MSQPHLICELLKLMSAQCLGNDVFHLLISLYVIKPHGSSLYTIPNEVIPDIDVLATIMKHWIRRELNASLIVTLYYNGLHPLSKIQITSHTAKLVAMYLASTEISATDLCFLLNQEKTIDPMLKTQPDVLF